MLKAHPLLAGSASGTALVLDEPLSFWGGVDPQTGRIIDSHHPSAGVTVAGTVLVMPSGRGSSSSASVLAECLRAGVGPQAIILEEPDQILLLGALVSREMDGTACPMVVLEDARASLSSGDHLSVEEDGTVRRSRPPPGAHPEARS